MSRETNYDRDTDEAPIMMDEEEVTLDQLAADADEDSDLDDEDVEPY